MRFRRLFRYASRSTDDIRRDIDDEIACHLTMRAEALEREGMTAEAARATAALEFGSRPQSRPALLEHAEKVERRRRVTRVLSELRQDIRYGTRLLRRSPAFSLAVIATITIAVGANTAVFGVVNALLLKPPPVADPGRLLRIEPREGRVSWPLFEAIRQRSTAVVDVAAVSTEVVSLGEPSATRRVIGEAVSPNYFALLGVPAALGRTIGPVDRGLDRVVLSNRAWHLHFDGDPSTLGKRITLDRRSYEVVGIMPPLFRALAPPGWVRDFWIPVESIPSHRRRIGDPAAARFQLIGRLHDEVTRSAALASVQAATRQAHADDPQLPDTAPSLTLVPVTGFAPFRGVGAMVPLFLFIAMLTLLAVLVLLIGCANIAGLMIGRATTRRQEIAVRIAVGAGPGRVVRQLLTESLLLAAAGGIGGVALAAWLNGAVHPLADQLPFPLEVDLAIDWRVVGYAITVSTFAALTFGLAPARRAARTDVVTALKDDVLSGRRQRARQVLIVAQVAACGVLLTWALLFSRSLLNVTAVDPGFHADGVVLAEISLGTPETSAQERDARFMLLQEAARAMPHVAAAGLAWAVPLTLSAREAFPVLLEGDERGARGRPVLANRVAPGWFDTLRIPLIAGRDVTWQDRDGAPEVAVVNRTLARRFWNGDAIGKRVRFRGRRDTEHDVQIVGIVGDSKYWTLGEEIEPTIYLPIRQGNLSDSLTLHIRTASPDATARALARELLRVAPEGFVEFRTMRDATAVAMMPSRVGAAVTAAFAGIAVLLATLGIYGLVSYTVAQRTREIGVRKAVGASTGDIVRMVLRNSLTLTAIGLLIGLAAAVALAPALGSFVVGVSPVDPLALGSAGGLVGLAVMAASAGPAWRAARVDPHRALNR